ncbi:hypothetical protein IPA_07755 [Ignicoccus pacificus DSM 13166]|uniref:Sulfotransferase domain-containing protein n=1 Tax=Ignicoccus pacificus DSM 13166 TaxID=940294 RepID=A0A977KBQ6_9CREN|nr:hypothetical protein IPA_07755 [Ignicoccus pacificus DSM 13166]
MMKNLEKPILINGSPRSGTTYLYRYLKKWNPYALFEPVSALVCEKSLPDGVNKHSIILSSPAYSLRKLGEVAELNVFWPRIMVLDFLEKIKGIPFKEITLHLYLDEPLITKEWEPYHIVRDPVSVYLSLKEVLLSPRMIWKLTGWIAELRDNDVPLLKNLVSSLAKLQVYMMSVNEIAGKLMQLTKCKYEVRYQDLFEAFMVYWILANYHAVRKVDEERLLVYEEPKTFLKLPNFEEYAKENPPKPVKRKNEKLSKRIPEIIKKYELEPEWEYLQRTIEKVKSTV